MKILSTLLLAFMTVGMLSSHAPSATGIEFYHNLEEAKKIAKKENKMIFLDGYASWCGPCKMMDKRVFQNQQVAHFYNANFINVKIDMDKNVKLRNEYKIRAYPTLLYLNADGSVIQKKVGFHDSGDFLKLGEKAKVRS
ncbi:MAG: DUF255 domain-containing protein [Bacteroidia bacterium]